MLCARINGCSLSWFLFIRFSSISRWCYFCVVRPGRPTERLIETERKLLRRLSRIGISALRPETLVSLRQYRWATPDHEVVFDALLRLANAPADSVRARLPVEATRMGFPDLDWDAYLDPVTAESESGESVLQLLAQMIAESADGQ